MLITIDNIRQLQAEESVIQSVSEEGDQVFDYDQVRVENPATLEKVQAALDAEGYEHEPVFD